MCQWSAIHRDPTFPNRGICCSPGKVKHVFMRSQAKQTNQSWSTIWYFFTSWWKALPGLPGAQTNVHLRDNLTQKFPQFFGKLPSWRKGSLLLFKIGFWPWFCIKVPLDLECFFEHSKNPQKSKLTKKKTLLIKRALKKVPFWVINSKKC